MTERRGGAAVGIATLGPIGYCPVAPGTAGSLAGLALVVGLSQVPLAPAWRVAALAACAAGLFAVGVWAAGKAEQHFARSDPRQVVIDEVVGQMLTFIALPGSSWKTWLAGFVLFRFLDVVKPFPAGRAERAPRGWGIMLDDAIAGGYSAIVLAGLGLLLK